MYTEQKEKKQDIDQQKKIIDKYLKTRQKKISENIIFFNYRWNLRTAAVLNRQY